jgi:putative Mg2+ transporter-C (MgtC) family protein
VILRDGVNVRGISTAATIWCSSAVGVLAGAGYIIQAIIGALLVPLADLTLRSSPSWSATGGMRWRWILLSAG